MTPLLLLDTAEQALGFAALIPKGEFVTLALLLWPVVANRTPFYTPDSALALADALQRFEGGDLLVDIAEMPIKCPVAPLEFVFLADWFYMMNDARAHVEIELVTPLTGAFTKPVATEVLTETARRKGIPISLSILYLLVAHRLDLELEPVGLPGHFIVGCFTDGLPFFIDPFDRGVFREADEILALLRECRLDQVELSDAVFTPAPYVIAVPSLSRITAESESRTAPHGPSPRCWASAQRRLPRRCSRSS